MPHAAGPRHTIAIHQVLQIVQGARDRGLDVDALLRRADIAPALLQAPLARVTPTQYAALIRVLRRATRDELWALCSQPLRLGSFAQACALMVHGRTLGQALRTGLQAYHVLLKDFVPRLRVQDGVAQLRVVSRGARDAKQAYAERCFCYLGYGVACWLVARPIPLQEVIFPQADAQLTTDASRVFQAPVRYAQGPMGWRFDARWLDLPVVQTPHSLHEFLQQAPVGLLVKYRDHSSVTERIRRVLRKHLDTDMPSLEAVGELLSMTPQTLRRRLREEGQGFQAIKDDLRRDAAIEYLARPDLNLIAIANQLGFSEASTFHRAFKGWTGVAPGAYRAAQMADRRCRRLHRHFR